MPFKLTSPSAWVIVTTLALPLCLGIGSCGGSDGPTSATAEATSVFQAIDGAFGPHPQVFDLPVEAGSTASVSPGPLFFPGDGTNSLAIQADWDDVGQNIDFRVFEEFTDPIGAGCEDPNSPPPPPYDGNGCTLLGSAETENKPEFLVFEPPPPSPSVALLFRNLGAGRANVRVTALASSLPVATPSNIGGGWSLDSVVPSPCPGEPVDRTDAIAIEQQGSSFTIQVQFTQGTLNGSIDASGAFTFSGSITEDGVSSTAQGSGQLSPIGQLEGSVTETISGCTHTGTYVATRVVL